MATRLRYSRAQLTHKATQWLRRSGKKIPETLAQIRKDWAQDQPIKLMFQDEARFGRISDVRRCWAPNPMRPLCQGMLTHEYTYVFGAVDVCTGELDSLILPHVNTGCMQLFLNEVSARHPDERIVMVISAAFALD